MAPNLDLDAADDIANNADTMFFGIEEHDCPLCGGEMPFECVGCPDGHGPECPDRVCTSCGTVIAVGPPPLAEPRQRTA